MEMEINYNKVVRAKRQNLIPLNTVSTATANKLLWIMTIYYITPFSSGVNFNADIPFLFYFIFFRSTWTDI